MKKIVLILFLAIIGVSSFAQDGGIEFDHSKWEKILKRAKKENKLIMMDAYTSWCGPCKWMSANVFTDKNVGEFYNKNFICTKIDMEKGEGPKLSEQYNVRAYPTILFINSKGEKVHVGVGGCEPADFIELGKTALDDKANLAYLNSNYKKNKSDAKFMYNYFSILQDSYEPLADKLAEYWEGQTEEQMKSPENWQIINNFGSDVNSKEIKLLLNNEKDFAKLYGEKEVSDKLFQIYGNMFYKVFDDEELTFEKYEKAKKEFETYKFSGQERIFLSADAAWYKYYEQNTEKYLEKTIELMEKYPVDDWSELNEVSWAIYENSEDAVMLEKGVKMARKSVELNSAHFNNDTLACLLFKTNKYKEAEKYALEALKLAKEEGVETEEYENNLKRIQEALK